jgi:hypothetical protein
MTVSGASVTFTGLDTDDDDDDDEDDNALPASWVGVEIKAPTNFLISTSSGYSVFASKLLTEIAPVVGMPVTLSFNSVDYDLFIAIRRGRMPFRERVAVQRNSVQRGTDDLRFLAGQHNVYGDLARNDLYRLACC